jgi:hypothetical protein
VLSELPRKSDDPDYLRLVSSCPYTLTTRTLGDLNQSAAYLILAAQAIQEVGGPPPAALHYPPRLPDMLKGVPLPYYSNAIGSKPVPVFDYNANALFRRAGEER